MDAGDDVCPVERAIALAAWTSIHLLKPVPFEHDTIAKTLAWKEDIETLDEELFIEALTHAQLPADSSGTIAEGSPTVSNLEVNQLPLRYYHFFEAYVDPRETNVDEVLDSIADALRTRLGSWAQGRAFAHMGFVMSCHGLTDGTRCCFATKQAPQYRHIEESSDTWPIRQTLTPRWSIARRDEALDGWSKPWQEWFRTFGPVRNAFSGTECSLHHRLDPDWDWGPPGNSPIGGSADCVAPRLLPSVCELAPHLLMTVLRDAHRSYQRARVRLPDFARAQTLADFLPHLQHADDPPDDNAALWHLALALEDVRVVSTALEAGFVSLTMDDETTRSSLERQSSLTMAAYGLAGKTAELKELVGRATGTLEEQTLHFYIRRKDDALNALFSSPAAARAVARVACAPCDLLDTLDHSDPQTIQRLHAHIRKVTDHQRPPQIAARHQSITYPDATSVTARDVNAARTRAENLFKLVIQHLYLVSPLAFATSHRDGVSAVADADGVANAWARPFWKCEALSDEALRPTGRFSLNELVGWSSRLSTLVAPRSSALPWLKKVIDSHASMRSLYGKADLANRGNLASHDNPASPDDLHKAVRCFQAFDEFVTNSDAWPQLVQCRTVRCQINLPTEVDFHRYSSSSGPDTTSSISAYFSGKLARRDSWRADRIYSLTDRTNNSISINPIVIDWTDWLTDREDADREPNPV